MPARRFARTAFAGMVLWCALLFVPLASGDGVYDLVSRLVLLAVLVVVPLLLETACDLWGNDARPMRWASRAALPAALLAAAAFLAPTGPWAGALTLGWAAFSALVAWEGVRRLVGLWREGGARGLWRRAEETAIALGLAALPGGAAWLSLSRAGLDPGPYGDLIVLLTAIHFHYAAVVVPVWAGYLGRSLRRWWPGALGAFRVATAAALLGTPLVALGIALSRTPAGGTAPEALGVAFLCGGAVGLGALALGLAPRLEDRWGGLMVGVSGGALALAMGLAVWFHFGDALGTGAPDVAWMVPRHGWLNGIGFALWGALAWRRLRPRAAASGAVGHGDPRTVATSPEA